MRIVNTTPAAQYLNYRDGTVIAIEPMGYVIRPAGDLDYLDDSAVSLARFSSGQLVLRNDDGSAYTGTALPGSPVVPPAQAVTVGPAGYLQGSGATAAALSSAVSGAGNSVNSIVLLGDSITRNNNTDTVGDATGTTIQHQLWAVGWFTWANIQLGGAFKVLRNSGIAGDTTGGMLARLQTDALAYSPQWVLVAGGINDRSLGGGADLGSDYTINNLRTIVERCLAAGSKVILATLLPNTVVNTAGGTKAAALLAVNDWIRTYTAGRTDVIGLDIFNVIYDPATTCGPLAGNFTDNTHPGVAGAHRIGTAAAQMLSGAGVVKYRGLFASVGAIASTTNPKGNLVRFGSMSGNGGTLPGVYATTGTVPDGWWLQQDGNATAHASHSITMTREAGTEGPGLLWWKTVVAWSTNQASVTVFTHRLLSASTLTIPAGVSTGDLIDCAIEVDYSGVNAGPLQIDFVVRQGTTELAVATFSYGETAVTPTPAFAGVVTPVGLPLPSGADNILVRAQCRNLAGTNGGYTLRMRRAQSNKR